MGGLLGQKLILKFRILVKMELAQLSMHGSTIHWFNLLRETKDGLTWEQNWEMVTWWGWQYENPFQELTKLKQERSMEQFSEYFLVSLITFLEQNWEMMCGRVHAIPYINSIEGMVAYS